MERKNKQLLRYDFEQIELMDVYNQAYFNGSVSKAYAELFNARNTYAENLLTLLTDSPGHKIFNNVAKVCNGMQKVSKVFFGASVLMLGIFSNTNSVAEYTNASGLFPDEAFFMLGCIGGGYLLSKLGEKVANSIAGNNKIENIKKIMEKDAKCVEMLGELEHSKNVYADTFKSPVKNDDKELLEDIKEESGFINNVVNDQLAFFDSQNEKVRM